MNDQTFWTWVTDHLVTIEFAGLLLLMGGFYYNTRHRLAAIEMRLDKADRSRERMYDKLEEHSKGVARLEALIEKNGR